MWQHPIYQIEWSSEELCKMEDVYRQKEAGKEVTIAKNRLFQEDYLLWGMAGVYQVDELSVLTRLLQSDWLKVISLEEAETVARLGMKSWCAGVGL